MIIKDQVAEALEDKVNKAINDIEKNCIFENIKLQYQTSVVPQVRGDKVIGYKVEYSVMISYDAIQLFKQE